MASNEGRATATVELEKDGETFHDSATAEGPCDAAFRAVDRITGTPGTIVDFTVHTVGPGTDGVAEVKAPVFSVHLGHIVLNCALFEEKIDQPGVIVEIDIRASNIF